ncbi:glycosyltransferase, group 1 family protein [Leptospira broomii serovar Hurstbridge str. 5399]|uniref:Glycosyltransferase, group 1 family protein n=1 Tax=Leptospira broomii serovar Hurstbridge str. 5399 TaxID=1049789 RepID=T0FGI6_9LEPT|nr:glycosyltransferase family 1 protein [Leptospira broomii]EQA47036.1 glycosyltransferase, group 1 family protein [Leptospira broomii serovar Hurstbridge str. 5399]
MKVIFDISVLGWAQKDNKARTGVFRVIENLLAQLFQDPRVELFLCSIDGNFENCISYLREKGYGDSHFIYPGKKREIPLFYKIVYSKYFREEWWRTRSTLFPLFFLFAFIDKVFALKKMRRAIPKQYLNSHFIFHSPFLPIPEYIRLSNISKVITIYDIIPILYPKYFVNSKFHLIHKIVGSIDRETSVIAISECTKSDFCKYRPDIDPSQVFVTYLAASESFYKVSDQDSIDKIKTKYEIKSKKYILTLCTIEPRKNLEVIIRAFSKLVISRDVPDTDLVLVGTKGWNYDAIFNEIELSTEIKEKIVVTGYAADSDLAQLYSGAVCFVYMSFYEGFGLPPLEAMKCGIPVIVSNSSSIPEVIGNAGILLEPTDEEGLIRNLLRVLTDRTLREDLSRKAIAQAKKFDWRGCERQTVQAYSNNKVPETAKIFLN